MGKRFRLIHAPARITVLGRDYYYYWDNADRRSTEKGAPVTNPKPGMSGEQADGYSPKEARERLIAFGYNPEEEM